MEEGVQPADEGARHREFGVGAQILQDLGLHRLRLLTNNPKKIVGLESYDLEVVEHIPLGTPKMAPVRRLAMARRGRTRVRR
jgi:3,4-dihydroxy 2-butanone 4-phosphate synthase/GTP cyclohydrolase II